MLSISPGKTITKTKEAKMTIDEAIEANEDIKRRHYNRMVDKEREAIQLGIEALKRLQTIRAPWYSIVTRLLPGETKEE